MNYFFSGAGWYQAPSLKIENISQNFLKRIFENESKRNSRKILFSFFYYFIKLKD